MSLGAGGGNTHLLYHLSALAVLPQAMGGKQACVVIIDTDNKLSVSRLLAQMKLLLNRHHLATSTEPAPDEMFHNEALQAIKHVHIFRPQSLASTIATIDSLPVHLFNQNRHYSFDREVAFIAVDSISAFYWQDRAETEDATFLATTTKQSSAAQTSACFQLSTSLKAASKALDCLSIITTWYLGSQAKVSEGMNLRSYRPQIPALQVTLRLVVHRLPVRKFPTGLSLANVVREAPERLKAVKEGKFECFVDDFGVEERLLRQLSGGGFGFRIMDDGLFIDAQEPEG